MKNCVSKVEQCIAEQKHEIARANGDTIVQIISDIHQKLDAIGVSERVDFVPTALVVVRDELQKLLMLHRTVVDRSYPDTYCFPGGKADENEQLINTALRETKEETALSIKIESEFTESYVPLERRGRIYLVKPYLATPISGVIRAEDIVLSEEHDAFEILSSEVALRRDEDPGDNFRVPGKLTREILNTIR